MKNKETLKASSAAYSDVLEYRRSSGLRGYRRISGAKKSTLENHRVHKAYGLCTIAKKRFLLLLNLDNLPIRTAFSGSSKSFRYFTFATIIEKSSGLRAASSASIFLSTTIFAVSSLFIN